MKKRFVFLLFSLCFTLIKAQVIEINERAEKYPLRLTVKSIEYVESGAGRERTKLNCELKNISSRNMSISISKDIRLLLDNGGVLKVTGTDILAPDKSYPLKSGQSQKYSLYFDRIPYDVKMVTYIGGSLRIDGIDVLRSKEPPNLYFVENSFKFEDRTENDAIDADENCNISFEVINKGKGNAYGCKVITQAIGNTQDIYFSPSSDVPTIKAGERRKITVPISSGFNTVDGKISFSVMLKEPLGFGTEPSIIEVSTRKFENPFVEVGRYTITSNVKGNTVLEKKDQFDLQLIIQNTGVGRAEDVVVELIKPNGVHSFSYDTIGNIGAMEPNEIKSLVYTLAITMDYNASTVPFKVKVKEKYGKFSKDEDIVLNFNQSFASNKIVIDAKEKKKIINKRNSLVFNSDVDKNIPETKTVNNNTYAVIIANENYNKVTSNVPLAIKDGLIFKEYCQKTLGIPDDNIIFYEDAGLADMIAAIDRIKDLDETNKDINIIFYYAGHGIHEDGTLEAYLLPVDGDGKNTKLAYSIDNLYEEFGNFRANSIVMFMDACFTGSQRGAGMIAETAGERGVAIAPKKSSPKGKTIAFAATSADQTAMPYADKEHGLFTYFLLKKLQETKGKCTLGDLGDYVIKNVNYESVNNRKIQNKQTPSVTPSLNMQKNWRTIKLVK